MLEDGGVKKFVLKEGVGEPIGDEDVMVRMNYTGKLSDGTIFDTSLREGKKPEPLSFHLGVGEVISGWDICVSTMRKGEVCRLTCDAKYAYGNRKMPGIPPHSTLIFEMKLLDAWPYNHGFMDPFSIFMGFVMVIVVFLVYHYVD
jgi:FKBP-type peptidyl-prolyl cis-trans isomerase